MNWLLLMNYKLHSSDGKAILISGGYNFDTGSINRLDTVEIFNPSNPASSCVLPSMTVYRYGHAQSGLTVCGGLSPGWMNCETFTDGNWTVSHSLLEKRRFHGMWSSPEGLVAVGGIDDTSAELLKDDGTSSKLFDLQDMRE